MRAAVDCGETDPGEVREEIVGGHCLWRKAGQPWKPGDTAESCVGVGGAIPIDSPYTPALAAEQERGWPIKRLTL